MFNLYLILLILKTWVDMIVHLIKEGGLESGKREVGPQTKVTLFTSHSTRAKLMNMIIQLMMMMIMKIMFFFFTGPPPKNLCMENLG